MPKDLKLIDDVCVYVSDRKNMTKTSTISTLTTREISVTYLEKTLSSQIKFNFCYCLAYNIKYKHLVFCLFIKFGKN